MTRQKDACPICDWEGYGLGAHVMMCHDEFLSPYEWSSHHSKNYQCVCGVVFEYLSDAEQHWANHGGLELHIMEVNLG